MMGAQEAPEGKKPVKVPGKKIDADALKLDVKAFASQLGLISGRWGDDAFGDFAPSKAKQKIGPANKPNKRQRLNDDAPSRDQKIGKRPDVASQRRQPPARKEDGAAKVAGRPPSKKKDEANANVKQYGGKMQSHKPEPARHGGGSSEGAGPGDSSKARDWNFGVGPRPGEAKGFKSLLGKSESSVWYRAAAALSSATTSAAADTSVIPGVDPDLFERRRAAAESLMEAEAAAFEKELQRRNPSDFSWLHQVRRAGTSTDRLAAATLLVQEGVVANMKALDQLISLATKRSGGKELVRQAMEGLQELFTNVLLPDRKLKFLEQQPLQDLPTGRDGEKLLLLWWTEDCVKRRYAIFIEALEEHSKDNLEFLKEKSMRVMAELLSSKPECEARLLAALVNKLGDPSRQVASKAVYLMMQLLATHPVMKPVVVREVERFVFRPGLADKARYYAVVFLNQVPLSHRASEGGDALARQLINVYFTMFRMVVEGQIGAAAQLRKRQEERYSEEKKNFWRKQNMTSAKQGGRGGNVGRRGPGPRGPRPPPPPKLAVADEVDARLLSGLITGVRRAFPYVKPEDVETLVEESSEQLFRLVHTAPFTVAVQALMLMYQLMSARAAISDRYYRSLYAALDREGPTTSSRAPMFLTLLFKAMQGDVSVKRVAAFTKRLLQVAAAAQPNWACGALMITSQVLSSQPALWASIMHPEDVGGSGVEEFKDKNDPDDELLADHDDDVDCFRDDDGNVAQGSRAKDASRRNVKDEHGADDDAELAGVGIRRRSHSLASPSGRVGRAAATSAPPPGSLAAKAAAAAQARATQAAATQVKWPQEGYYQMDKREPLYANADRSCWWELTALANHAHPSVSAMARSLLSGAPVVYNGDPLRDLSLVSFLDKFVNKKPKPVARGTSVMQPSTAPLGGTLDLSRSTAGTGKKEQQQPRPLSLAQMSREAFAALAEAQVDSADLFFHKFFNLKGIKDKAAQKRKTADKDVDDDESLSEADDDEVDRYLEKQEVMADDALGDPDLGYDYEQLAAAMENGGLEEEAEDDDMGDEDDASGECEGSSDEEDEEDSLEGVGILGLPSPSSDDEAEEEGGEAAACSRRKRHREIMEAAGITEGDLEGLSSDDELEGMREKKAEGDEEEGEDEDASGSDGDDEFMGMMAGGSNDADIEEGDEPPHLMPVKTGRKGKGGGETGKKDKKANGKGGGGLFASADDYEALIDRAERDEAAGHGKVEQEGRGGGLGKGREGEGDKRGRDSSGRRVGGASGRGRSNIGRRS